MYWELTMLCFTVIVDGHTYRHTDSLSFAITSRLNSLGIPHRGKNLEMLRPP